MDLTVDHIRPRIYGDVNPNDERWWRVLCRSCNATRGTSDLTLDQIRERRQAQRARPSPSAGTITFLPHRKDRTP